MMTHTIYFAQHGLAVDKAEDPERPLSPSGRDQTETIANTLLDAKIPVTNIFHSGKLRASQTAEIFARILKISSLCAIEDLSPNDDVTLLAQKLNVDHALYIGHLPHLEKLAAYLLTNNENTDILKFQNSGVLCLGKNNRQYHIKWLLTPELSSDTFNP